MCMRVRSRNKIVRFKKKVVISVFQQLFHCFYNWKTFLRKGAAEQKLFACLDLNKISWELAKFWKV